MICCQFKVKKSLQMQSFLNHGFHCTQRSRYTFANFIHGLLSRAYCFAKHTARQIIVIIFYNTKFKVLFLAFLSAYIVIEMAKMWSDVLVLGSGVKTKLYWHWVPLVRQTLTTGENPNLILLKADV